MPPISSDSLCEILIDKQRNYNASHLIAPFDLHVTALPTFRTHIGHFQLNEIVYNTRSMNI